MSTARNSAIACYRSGNLPEAERACVAVLDADPADAVFHHLLGLVRFQLGRNEEALASFDQAVAIRADYAEALNNRGAALRELQRLDEALASYDRVLAINPDDFRALNNRGLTLADQERYGDALADYDKALAIKPDYAGALNNRGNALRALRRLDEALANFSRAVQLDGYFAAAHFNRAITLFDLKRFAEALAGYDQVLALDPQDALSWNNRGGALQGLGRPHEALASFDRALAIKTDFVEALYHRAGMLQDLKRHDEALESYGKAIALRPGFAAALAARGQMQWRNFGDFAAAIADLEGALAADPDAAYIQGDLLHLKMYCAAWDGFARAKALLDDGVRAGRKVATPFVYQVVSDSPADLQACAALYSEDRFPAAPALWKKTSHSKIRIGYVSGEFREQATASLTAGLYEAHDKSRFEIIAFDSGWRDNSAMRRRLEVAFGKFVDIAGLSDRAAADAIVAEEIDILVNLNGHFGQARMGVFAHRPAPIQVNYLGFPGTLGADYVDYILADRIVIPEDDHVFYSESVVTLPNSYQVNDRAREAAALVPARGENGLPENAFVFCNFNQSYKLTPAMFAAWMRIMGQSENSVLWLLESNALFAANLRREAARLGVAAERLIFAPALPVEKHLARLTLADLFLDSAPCNAHTTASDALWMGLPLLTCRGHAFAGRVAASLLEAIGLPELASDDLAHYEAQAVRLAADASLLQGLRQKLAGNRLTTPLFDTARFTRHIEEAYATMWDIHLHGEPPRRFSV